MMECFSDCVKDIFTLHKLLSRIKQQQRQTIKRAFQLGMFLNKKFNLVTFI